MIYLDNNATTLLDPRVVARMHELMQSQLANPSSQHAAGRQARQVVEQARDSILSACGARTTGMASDTLLFTSGGTEANNLALFGLTENRPGSIVVSSIEHPSILGAAEYAAAQGRKVHYLPCEPSGQVALKSLESLLENHRNGDAIALVSWMRANNETGVIQPIAQAASLCRQAGVWMHTDAVQALGKSPLSFRELEVDAMTITAHKLHGPVGIGALLLRHGVTIAPQIFGGFQQLGLRPGTEPPVLAGGFARAVELAVAELIERSERMQFLRDKLEQGIRQRVPHAIIVGEDAPRLPHTLSVAFPGRDRQALQLALDMSGVACSTGSACASGSSQPSHVLEAMGLAPEVVRGGIRLSVSTQITVEEIEQAIEIIARVAR